jgi:hypothetical protein
VKTETIGQKIAKMIVPCTTVFGQITVRIPYHTHMARMDMDSPYNQSELEKVRAKLARYIDKQVSKPPTRRTKRGAK